MNDTDKKRFLEAAISVAKAAGDRLKGISQRRVNSDAGNDVKLQEDVESELFIRAELERTGIPVIGEERGGELDLVNNGGLYWVVDPIDGTYNFLRGIPGVCVSIALMKGWEPVVGAIYDFTRGELFAGGRGLPLTINGEEKTPHWAKTAEQGVLMTGFPSSTDYSDANLRTFIARSQKFKKVRMCGSAALAMAWVAAGRADVYGEDRVYLWDIAAGLSLMESVGAAWSMTPCGIASKPLCLSIQAASCKEFFVG